MKYFLIIISICIFLSGCVSTPYKTLKTIGDTVDAAMKAYATQVVLGRVSLETQAKIRDLHDNKFNPAFKTAILAARLDYSKPSPEDVTILASQLVDAITLITK